MRINFKKIFLTFLFTILNFTASQAEDLEITIIGESTSLGFYEEKAYPYYSKNQPCNFVNLKKNEHPNNPEASIPLMIKNAVEEQNIKVVINNKASSSTTVGWHLGIKPISKNHTPYCQQDIEKSPKAGKIETLLKGNSTIVVIQVGINDAHIQDKTSSTDKIFKTHFERLIQNIVYSGKKAYVVLPNNIKPKKEMDKLKQLAYIMNQIASKYSGVTVLNKGTDNIKYLNLGDDYHPIPGTLGYKKLGLEVVNQIKKDAKSVFNHLKATRYYIAMFNRPPEKEGLTYWANLLLKKSDDFVANLLIKAAENHEDKSLSDNEFIIRVYKNLFNRYPDSEGKKYWLSEISKEKLKGNIYARGKVLNQIIKVLVERKNNSYEGIKDQQRFRNRVAVGFAYGYIYGKSNVTDTDSLTDIYYITDDVQSVYDAISTF